MSHYPIFVIGKDIEQQLAPYEEYNGDPNGHQVFIDYMNEVSKWAETNNTSLLEETQKYGFGLLQDGEKPNVNGLHKWGYYTLDEDGNLKSVFKYDTENPKWDWYEKGGRWEGYLRLKNGECASEARIGDIDFENWKKENAAAYAKRWDKFHAVVGDTPFKTLAEIRQENKDVNDVRLKYSGQAAIKAIREVMTESEQFALLFEDPLEILRQPRDKYIEEKSALSVLPTAIVKDGKWYQKEEVGWFGMSHDAIPAKEWIEKANELLASLPKDEIVTVIDCHT